MRENPKQVTFISTVDTGEPAARNRACLDFAGDIFSGKDVLDVGCWSGGFLSLVSGAASLTGLDIEPGALAVARQNLSGAAFVEASVLDMPFDSGSFDLVTLWAVMEHLPAVSEAAALEEINRVLRPGGLLALNVPNANPVAKALDPIFLIKGHRHFKPTQIRQMLSASGFTLGRMSIRGRTAGLLCFLLFCFWKYLVRRPEPTWQWYRRACERDAMREGFVELYALARRV